MFALVLDEHFVNYVAEDIYKNNITSLTYSSPLSPETVHS